MQEKQKIPLLLLGMGTIGGELLRQIVKDGETITRRTGLSLLPIGISDSSGALTNPDGFSNSDLLSALKVRSAGQQLHVLDNHRPLPLIKDIYQPGLVVIDLTASSGMMPLLLEALEQGCGIVMANKIPLTGPWQEVQRLFEDPNVYYESTVGAGLPLIETLRYLLDTGDEVTVIEGCFSGTLGYLCTELEKEVPFSEAISTACQLGYAEPDPRIDLSGKDVARKALILARSAGWPLTENELIINALFPESLAAITRESFLSEMSSLDEGYRTCFENTAAESQTLRYVARLTPEGGKVGLIPVDKHSSLGALRGPANYVSLQTKRYAENPLIISGPGAGPAVTAAGVLGDVIKFAQKKPGGSFQ